MKGLLIFWIFPLAAWTCTFPDDLIGTWTTTWPTSTTGQTFVFGTSGAFFSSYVLSTGAMNMTCLLTSGTVYLLQSNSVYEVFTNVPPVYTYMCIDVRSTSSNDSKYFYLNSAEESGFSNLRLKGIANTTVITSMETVCDATPDVAEYHALIRTGSENNAAQQCPDRLLGNFWYTFTDGSGTVCDNTTLMDVCSNNLTHVLFNETSATAACSAKFPMWAETGPLSCVISFTKTDTTTDTTIDYVTLYNHDSTVTDSTTYRFTCLAMTTNTTDGSTVYLSLNPKDCVSGQSPTTRTTDGVLMVLTPFYTCVPTDVPAEEPDYTVLIIVLILIVVFLVVAALLLYILFWYRDKVKRKRIREKMILINAAADDHPMGEISMSLDAPASLEPVSDNAYLESRDEVYKVPRDPRKPKAGFNPLGESSLNLDFKGRTWANLPPLQQSIPEENPFLSELGNGAVPEMELIGSKMERSLRTTKPRSKPMVRSFTMHNTKARGLANGDLRRYRSVESNMGMSVESVTGELNDTDILSSFSTPMYKVKTGPETPRTTRSVKTIPTAPPQKAKTPRPAAKPTPPEPEIVVTPVGFVKKPASRATDRSGAKSVTKIGSVTRSGSISPRKSPRKPKRSKTMVISSKSETEADTDATAEMKEFLDAETLWRPPETIEGSLMSGSPPKTTKTAVKNGKTSPTKRRTFRSKTTLSKAGLSTNKKKKKKTKQRGTKSEPGGSPIGTLTLKAKPVSNGNLVGYANSTTASQAKMKTPRISKQGSLTGIPNYFRTRSLFA